MACDPFDVVVPGDPSTLFDRVKAKVESQGGTVTGDASSGTISGHVPLFGDFQGSYTVSGSTVTITVTKKPFLVSCSVIESGAGTFLSGA